MARLPKTIQVIDIPLYHTAVYVARTKKDYQAAYDYFIGAGSFEKDGVSTNVNGYTLRLKQSCGIEINVVGMFSKENGTIAHEFAHTSFFILDYVGVTVGGMEQKNEAFCYLLGYLIREYHSWKRPVTRRKTA